MSAAAVLSLAFGGLSLIGLSMQRHARAAGLKLAPPWLRGLGWTVLMLSLAAALAVPNWRFALVEWFGEAAAAAGLVVLALYLRPGLLPRLALAGIALGFAAALFGLMN